jgi:glycosyltransferase involved in cell wall biosynthesis
MAVSQGQICKRTTISHSRIKRISESPTEPEKVQDRILYASFDRFPSPKGAATHIDAFVRALGRKFGNVDLLTIPSEAHETERADVPAILRQLQPPKATPVDRTPEPAWNADGVVHHPMYAHGENFFERVLNFRSRMQQWWLGHLGRSAVSVVHFRSIFEGYPIARQKKQLCHRLVYEVNGLPSIELKYRYPNVADDSELLAKLLHQEDTCLAAADAIITVSAVNAEHLMRRGVAKNRITVIRNGVDLDLFAAPGAPAETGPATSSGSPMQILYSGTMSAWQGVSHAIEAVALFRRDHPAKLTLVGPVRPRQRKELNQQIWNHGITDSVEILNPVSKSDLAALHHGANVILAPLTRNDRNLEQGCCPLKVLEAMASGTPLIASDIPVVRELASNDVHAILVKPGSSKPIKDGMLKLLNEPGLGQRLSSAARRRAEQEFSWQRAQAQLLNVYETLLSQPDTSPDKSN